MPNVKNLIKQHNSKILIKDQDKIKWCRIIAELKKVVKRTKELNQNVTIGTSLF